MKTNFLTAAFIILAGILGFENNSIAHNAPAHRNTHRIAAKSLAEMKVKNIQFGFNKAEVPVSAFGTLDKVSKLMTGNNASVKLGGYADNKGAYVYNWKLSKKRAEAVKAYLVKKGADSTRIAAVEYGYTHPIASNKTPGGRKKNRRVEIHFAN